jgi:anion-transporting  ArsA/GET3 family ATPase
VDREAFCRQSNVVVVAGKGGVGKTTVTAALARMAADVGLEVLVVELDDAGGLHNLFGRETAFEYEEAVLYEPLGAGRVRGRVITPDDALVEYLMDHGLRRVAKRLVAAGVLEVVATAIPGIREVLVLGKVKQLERSGTSDLIVLDAPAAGHAVTFLTSALGLMDAARGGPLRSQAQDVVEMLRDPARCQVMLVSLPEETPVNELIETAYRFEDLVGVALAPVVVNACYPVLTHLSADPVAAAAAAGAELPGPEEAAQLAAAAEFRSSRQDLQAMQMERLAAGLPLPQLALPYQFTADLGPKQLGVLSRALGADIDALVVDEPGVEVEVEELGVDDDD